MVTHDVKECGIVGLSRRSERRLNIAAAELREERAGTKSAIVVERLGVR